MNIFIRTTHLLRFLPILLLFGATLLTGCSGGKEGNGEDDVEEVAEESAANKSGEMLTSAAGDDYNPVITHTATLKTKLGNIVFELYGEDAPKTVANFVGLAKQDFYDGIVFHRVVPGFVIQGGDPKSKDTNLRDLWGQGGSSIFNGAEFEDELNPATPSYKRGYRRGVIAMANRGANTNTSQFFIMVGSTLPPQYTIFGYVREGMDVVDAIVANGSGTPPRNLPDNPIAIQDVTVTEYKAINLGK